jgi:UDP-N-acetylmuramate dehydrogenase
VTGAPLIQENVLLAPLTTLGIGGPARYFAEATSENAVLDALSFAEQHKFPVFILGGGSNLLVADEGFPGLVIHIAITGTQARKEGEQVIITASAGEDWDAFVSTCVERGWAGLECLSGIPGLVGGAPVQNVGAYGQEVSETILAVRAYDRQKGRIVELANAACGFSYRTSIFNTSARDRYIVLAVTYQLAAHGRPTIRYADVERYFAGRNSEPSLREVREAVRMIRASKAMLLLPGDPDCHSAGSFFKNPVVTAEKFAQIEEAARAYQVLSAAERVPRYDAPGGQVKVSAAWLIERAGLHKGYQRGRVGLSTKHTLAIINRGGATAREVVELMREIQSCVEERFGVALVPEPVFVGFDGSSV